MANVSNVMNISATLNDFARSIELCGDKVTFLGMGEPGIGKSSTYHYLRGKLAETHDGAYVDAALLDLGDMQMPEVRDGVFHFVPNSLFVSPSGRPMIIMVDELGKASRSVKTALLPLLLEHRIGNHKLPDNSIVFATTNLASDGVGDLLEAHGRNRVCVVNIQKPDAESWIKWAINNDIDEAVQQFAREYPHCFASYTDPAQKDNHMIFHPDRQQAAFLTHRSMEKVSHIAKQRVLLAQQSPTLFHTLVAGLVGAPAAAEMRAFFDEADKLIPWAEIMKNPKKAEVPKSALQQQLLAQRAVTQVKKEELDNWLTYMERMHDEIQVMFFSQMTSSSRLVDIVNSGNKKYFKLLEEKAKYLVPG